MFDISNTSVATGCLETQVVGKRGDVVVVHPWTIHSGTTNMGDTPRLMTNGMIRVKQEAFAKVGCKVLLSDQYR